MRKWFTGVVAHLLAILALAHANTIIPSATVTVCENGQTK
jgi:hypothetical protein